MKKSQLSFIISCIASVVFVASITSTAKNSRSSADSVVVHAAGQGNPWINLRDGVNLAAAYTGAVGLQQIMANNLTLPLTLASGDFDEDGVPDLVTGHVGPSGGILTLHRGNLYSIYPNHLKRERSQRGNERVNESTSQRGNESTGQRGNESTGQRGNESTGQRGNESTGQWGNESTGQRGNESTGQWGNESTSSLIHLPIDPLTLVPGDQPLPFFPAARLFEVPEAPELVGTGDFDNDGHFDVVTAAVGGQALYLLAGDGRGSLLPAQPLELPGTVTALATGEINRADGLIDLVVGMMGPDGPQVRIFESPTGAWRAEPEAISLPTEATALALGQLDEDYAMDLAIAAGDQLLIVHGRDRRLSTDGGWRLAAGGWPSIDHLSFPFTLTSLVLGDFAWDEDHRTEIALLSVDGQVHLLQQRRKAERGMRREPRQKLDSPPRDDWILVESIAVDLASNRENAQSAIRHPPSAIRVVPAKVSSLSTDDLVLVDSAHHQVHILNSWIVDRGSWTVNSDGGLPITNHESRITNHATLDVEGEPVAILPMRLNEDALSDLVILQGRPRALTVALTAPIATFTVINTNDSDAGSLRQAILDANTSAGADLINFNIPGTGPHTIRLVSALPPITDVLTLDGTTQPGFMDMPMIELDGSLTRGAGLILRAGTTTVRGLTINRFSSGAGIGVQPNGHNLIEGNLIGTDITGRTALGNDTGVAIVANANILGGTTAAARNVISGNRFAGVLISAGSENQVQGNSIGADAPGMAAVGNLAIGVLISAPSNNTVGGTGASARNVISGNGNGIEIEGRTARGNLLQGNSIGTDATGTFPLGNSRTGVFIENAASNTIGGTAVGAGNVISANGNGVWIFGRDAIGNQVQGNLIGMEVEATVRLGNFSDGVIITNSASHNVIGGEVSGAGNTISFNGGAGVFISASDPPATGNAIAANAIFSNSGLGIDLDPIGVTPNDPRDIDAGPNHLQNFPELISAASSGGNLIISGRVQSRAHTVYRVEFFVSIDCDPSGYGEGATLVGSATVRTSLLRNVRFRVVLPAEILRGQVITATATDPDNNTSEFSPCLTVR